jgi:transcriptional regulator with XRE-family HTH domain
MEQSRLLLRVIRAAQEPRVSQAQIAKRAGLGLHRYWQIENGEGPDPSLDEKAAIAAALGVEVAGISWPETARARTA